jgi:hypothetical protein
VLLQIEGFGKPLTKEETDVDQKMKSAVLFQLVKDLLAKSEMAIVPHAPGFDGEDRSKSNQEE